MEMNPHEIFTKINRWIYYRISKIYGPLGIPFILPQIQSLFLTTSVDDNTKCSLIQANFTHIAKNKKFKINQVLHLFYEYTNNLETLNFSIPRRSFVKAQHRYLEVMQNFNYYTEHQNSQPKIQELVSKNPLNDPADLFSAPLGPQNSKKPSKLQSQKPLRILPPIQLPENEFFDDEEEEEEGEEEEGEEEEGEEEEGEEEEGEEEEEEAEDSKEDDFIDQLIDKELKKSNNENQINEIDKFDFNQFKKETKNKSNDIFDLVLNPKDDDESEDEEEESMDCIEFLKEVYANPEKFNPMIALTNHYLQQPDSNLSEDFIEWFNSYCNHVNSVLFNAFKQFKELKNKSEEVLLSTQVYLTNPVVKLVTFCKELAPISFYKRFKQMIFIQEDFEQKFKDKINIKYIQKEKQHKLLDMSYIMIEQNMVSGQVKNKIVYIEKPQTQQQKLEEASTQQIKSREMPIQEPEPKETTEKQFEIGKMLTQQPKSEEIKAPKFSFNIKSPNEQEEAPKFSFNIESPNEQEEAPKFSFNTKSPNEQEEPEEIPKTKFKFILENPESKEEPDQQPKLEEPKMNTSKQFADELDTTQEESPMKKPIEKEEEEEEFDIPIIEEEEEAEEEDLNDPSKMKIDDSLKTKERYTICDMDDIDKYGSIEFLSSVNDKQFGIVKTTAEDKKVYYYSTFLKFNECSIELRLSDENKKKIASIKDSYIPMKITLKNVFPYNHVTNKREMPGSINQLDDFKASIDEYLEENNLEFDSYDPKTGTLCFIVNRISSFPVNIPKI